MKRVMLYALGMALFSIMHVSAQIYPDTLWVPVTYYDFRSNTSNPEFQCDPYNSGVSKGMIQDTLDADHKPIATNIDANIMRNKYIKYWYRDWEDSARGDNTIPAYDQTPYNQGGVGSYLGYSIDVGNDNSFQNIVIQDSLPFEYIEGSAGVYEFKDDTFFPLDDRGFGKEGRTHNYAFTMELHWTFTMQPGMTFHFKGDDDVWAFINNSLEMDIGGIHNAQTDSFHVDDITGLENGKVYPFDFFFAERHTGSSHIWITTNIISVPPSVLSLTAEPSGDICAGDTMFLLATVLDDTGGVRPEIGENTSWNFIQSSGNAYSTIFPHTGDKVRFSPTEAWGDSVKIEGIVVEGSITLRDTLTVYVRACYPDHLVIEGSPPPYTGNALRNDNPLSELRIASDRQSDSAYAVIRDRFGNFVEASKSTAWSVTQGSGTIINRVVNGDQNLGQGVVYKQGPAGSGEVAAKSSIYNGAQFTDLLPVVVDNVTYNSLRIMVNSNGTLFQISKLTSTTESCTLLIVQGERSDGLGWDAVPGDWALSSPLRASIDPPSSSQSWNFCPTVTGNGTITASYAGRSTQISVIVNPGGPASINLFPSSTGTIAYPQPPSLVDSIAAGTNVPIFARIYDPNGVLLPVYSTTTAPITWTIQEISGIPPTGTLQGPGGNQNTLYPTRAYNIVQVKATFNENGRIFSDSVRFKIIPGAPDHITIQIDTASQLNWTDISQFEFGPTDTTRLLYPVIRDRFDNFIKMAEFSQWSSRDTSVATAAATERIFFGEGIVTRIADSSSQTWADVISPGTPQLKDSVRIVLSTITYDSLQIYILDNGPKLIDTIRVRTDENQLLYARGKRSDGRGWDDIPVTWNVTSGLNISGVPPAYSQNWNIIPNAIDTGKVFITRSGSVPDSITAIFLPGLPGSMALHKGEGNPAIVPAYPLPPLTDTIVAGSTYPFVAKIFDRNRIWLPQYENNTTSASLISWQLVRVAGNTSTDTLDRRTGASITFSPKKAFITYQITATFLEGTRQFSATAQIYVKAGPAHHLVIEGSSNPSGIDLNFDSPINSLSFGSKDTTQYAYAIIRDINQNYVGRSQSTNWQSLNTSLVIASEAISTLGQGKVLRIGDLGETQVIAWNRNSPVLRDTVLVRVTDFSYDSLRIVVQDSIKIIELVMRSDQDTNLQVIGLRSYDQKWVPVTGDWVYASTNLNLNQQAVHNWLFTPGITTSGTITVTNGTAVPSSIPVYVTPGLASKLVLYPKRGPVSINNVAYANPPDTITAIAGTNLPLVSKIFDHNDVWLNEYEVMPSTNLITWSIVEFPGSDSSGVLTTLQGDSTSFFSRRAYQRVYVIGKLTANNKTYLDTVLLSIVPGSPYDLFIEGSPNWQASKNRPNPIDTINILSNTTNAPGYAIIRDSLGNFHSYSTVTTWGVVNNDTSISVRNGITAIGEGIIERHVTSATAQVYAIDAAGFRDTAFVVIRPYYYSELRILVDYNPDPDSLVMPTTSDTTLRVQGLRSDTTIWEFVNNGIWEISPNLSVTPVAPIGRQWRFSPTDTGTGIIRVTLNNDLVTKPDTLKVKFIPGPPTEMRLSIITPEQQRIAGKQIQMVIELYNEDGRVKGPYDFSSVTYKDVLPDGTGRPRPFVIVGIDTVYLDSLSTQHFDNGIDTVGLVLFYAPWSLDSLHQITTNMNELSASTELFRLLPGDLDKLVLERDARWVSPIEDTLVVRSGDNGIQITAVGYDLYQNRRGAEPSNWTTDSTLHPISGTTTNTSLINYYLDNVQNNEAGNIIAVPSDTAYKNIMADVFIKILGPPIKLTSATTGDFDGNGYLDHIIMKFDRPVTLPPGYPIDIKMEYNDLYFNIDEDSISMDSSRTDSIWVIAFPEEIGNGTPQTSWEPTITFDRNDDLGIDSVLNHPSIDGAGPVVVSVTKTYSNLANDRRQDSIMVVFSEPIQRSDFGSLTVLDTPKVFLYVWEKDPVDSTKFILLDSILTGIDNLTKLDDISVSFLTSNGADIDWRHYFSIKTVITTAGDTTSYITDRVKLTNNSSPNTPNVNNRQVQVVPLGNPRAEITTFPNPATPTARRVDAGTFIATHEPQARDWVVQDNAGVIFNISFMLPPEKDVKIKCIAKIYDVTGNMVATSEDSDVRVSLVRSGATTGVVSMDIYWNGTKENTMKVAPGIYKIIVYLDYYGSSNSAKYTDERKTGILGIRHGEIR